MASSSILLPNGDYAPAQSWSQDTHTVKGQQVVVTDSSGNIQAPLTDTQLRATAVPVSGTVTASGPLTDAQLRASPLPIEDDTPVKLRGSHASTISARTTGIQGTPVLDVRLVEDALGVKLGQDPLAPLSVASSAVRSAAHVASTAEITPAVTTGAKESLAVWHPSSLAAETVISRIHLTPRTMWTTGAPEFSFQYITTIPTGGAAVTPQQLNRSNGAAGVSIFSVLTGGAATTGQVFGRVSLPAAAAATTVGSHNTPIVLFDADWGGGIVLRNGQAEGIKMVHDNKVALGGTPLWTITVFFTEL